jgi:hypothetical protein
MKALATGRAGRPSAPFPAAWPEQAVQVRGWSRLGASLFLTPSRIPLATELDLALWPKDRDPCVPLGLGVGEEWAVQAGRALVAYPPPLAADIPAVVNLDLLTYFRIAPFGYHDRSLERHFVVEGIAVVVAFHRHLADD